MKFAVIFCSASLLWASPRPLWAQEAEDSSRESATSQDAEARTEAAERFRRGIEFYDSGDFGLALIEFERAYQLVPDYRVLYNVGQVSIQLSRFARARQALAQYLREGEGSLDEARRQSVERDMLMLEARTAYLVIESNVSGAEVLVDDVPLGILPLKEALLLDAGEHTVVTRKSGYVEQSQRITLAGADRQELSFELDLVPAARVEAVQSPAAQPVPEKALEPVTETKPYSPWLTAGWVATGALAGGAVTAALLGMSSSNKAKSISESPNPSTTDYDEQVNRADSRFVVADVLAGAALVTGGTTLFFHLRSRSAEGASVGVAVSPQQVLLRGKF